MIGHPIKCYYLNNFSQQKQYNKISVSQFIAFQFDCILLHILNQNKHKNKQKKRTAKQQVEQYIECNTKMGRQCSYLYIMTMIGCRKLTSVEIREILNHYLLKNIACEDGKICATAY